LANSKKHMAPLPGTVCGLGFEPVGLLPNVLLGAALGGLSGLDATGSDPGPDLGGYSLRPPGRLVSRNFSRTLRCFATAAGVGPFIREIPDQSALLTQEFVVLFTGMVLYIAAFVHQNRRNFYKLRKALAEVKHLNETLEDRVRQRTRELSKANQQLQTLALTDELTGIANRRQMKSLGEEEANRSDRSQRPFSVMLLDIDHFKPINDRYGHDVGDHCLQVFAQAIESVLRSVDRFGRWGGEEFIIIVFDSDQLDLVHLSEKVLDSVRGIAVAVDDQNITMTVSIGVAEWHGTSFDELVSEADDALYRAKAQGRDRAEFSTVVSRVSS